MTEQTRRVEDSQVQVLSSQIEHLLVTIEKMEQSISTLAVAVSEIAVFKERQNHVILSQERGFKALERVEKRQEDHERNCRQQEKDLLAVIGRTTERLSERIEVLEKAEPMQSQTSKWTLTAIWAVLGFLALFVANRGLALIFP